MNGSAKRQHFSSLIFQDDTDRVRKIKWVILFFTLALALVMLNSIFVTGIDLVVELFTTTAILFGLYFFVSRDTTQIVAGILVWTLSILAFSVAWGNDGLYDTSMLLFPCLIVIAAILGSKLLLYTLSLFLVLVLYFFAFAIETGFMEPREIPEVDLWGKANNMALMLVVYLVLINGLLAYAAKIVRNLFAENQAYQNISIEAENQVLYDRLTGLPNEVVCEKNMALALGEQAHFGQMIGFISLSLDNINLINSSLGHGTGDKAIVHKASQLTLFGNEKTEIYRSSGNEFILTFVAKDYEELEDFTYQVMQMVNRPFQVDSYDIEVPCSLGIAVAPMDGDEFVDLRRRSNIALARAKEDEQQVYRFFEDEMEMEARTRLQMIGDLKHAIKENEFALYYQPKICLESNEIIGAEALIRWNKSDGSMVSPAEFIPVAETSGLMSEIGAWVIQKACQDCANWRKAGLSSLKIAVNLSPVQFRRGDLPNVVFRSIEEAGITPDLLELEITESLIIDDSHHASNQIGQFVDKGISIAIDDFGTGYSNLNYLTKFKARDLKIDMSFVREMLQIENKRHIVQAIIKMSSEMGLNNVAEGVEDAETAELLRSFECKFAQGYYWSRPLPNPEFIQFVKGYEAG